VYGGVYVPILEGSPMRERCSECRFWRPRWAPQFTVPEREKDNGYCHFNGPGAYHEEIEVPLQSASKSLFTLKTVEVPFPPILRNDWCGKFERATDSTQRDIMEGCPPGCEVTGRHVHKVCGGVPTVVVAPPITDDPSKRSPL
jgi:hypothetical protein